MHDQDKTDKTGTREAKPPRFVILQHTVPVSVEVDLENGRVAQVVVHDEELSPPLLEKTDASVPPEIAKRAADIAQQDEYWPAWKFGW